MCVLTSATDSFNIHTSLVWLDPSLSLRIHANGNYNGNYHVRTHAIQRVEREGSSYTRLHTHMSVHCGYRDMMYMCWYRIEISHYIRLTCGHSNSIDILQEHKRNEKYFLMFLECNNHVAHGPTDYHAYATITNRQKQFLWTYVIHVCSDFSNRFLQHTH